MKKILLSAFFIGSIANLGAQTIYSNDFSTPAGLSIIDADGDTFNWGLSAGSPDTEAWGLSGNFAVSRSWNPANATLGTPAMALNPDNFLITPSFTIPSDDNKATILSFKLGSSDLTYFAEQISIYVTPATVNTNGDIIATPVVFNRTLTAANARTAITYSVDISEYAGQTVRVALRHHDSPDQNLLYFDDLLVSQSVLSTEDFNKSKFSVYPNPANDVVTISNAANATIDAVTVSDLNGRTVKSVKLNGETTAQVNIADLSAGVYMMNISSDQGTSTKKIVKK